MYDGIKWELIGVDPIALMRKHYIVPDVNPETGEETYPTIHLDKNLTIKVIARNRNGELYVIMQGSLHRWYNNVKFGIDNNKSDYTLKNFKETMEMLMSKYNFHEVKPINLEFGLNLTIEDHNCREILLNVIHHFRGKLHTKEEPAKFNKGIFKEWKQDNFILKTYEKGPSILRVEIKYYRHKHIKQKGIETLENLYDSIVLQALYNDLRDKVSGLCMIDHNLPNNVTKAELDVFNKIRDTHYIRRLRQAKKYSKLSREKNKFDAILSKYNLDTTKVKMLAELENKFTKTTKCKEYFLFKQTQLFCNENMFPRKRQYGKRDIKNISRHDEYLNKYPRNKKSNPAHNCARKYLRVITKLERTASYMIDKIVVPPKDLQLLIKVAHVKRYHHVLRLLGVSIDLT